MTAYIRLPPSKCIENQLTKSRPRAHGRNPGANQLPTELPCLLCFAQRCFSSEGRRPQNGSASTGKLNHSSVCCGNRSMHAWQYCGACARIPPNPEGLHDKPTSHHTPLTLRSFPTRPSQTTHL